MRRTPSGAAGLCPKGVLDPRLAVILQTFSEARTALRRPCTVVELYLCMLRIEKQVCTTRNSYVIEHVAARVLSLSSPQLLPRERSFNSLSVGMIAMCGMAFGLPYTWSTLENQKVPCTDTNQTQIHMHRTLFHLPEGAMANHKQAPSTD